MNFSEYVRAVEAKLRAGNATEHTYREDLAALINDLAPGVRATNEPKRSDFGAIDYVVDRTSPGGRLPIGYVEAKDVGINLSGIEKTEQLKRYRRSLSNLILTDYLEFRWYLDGVHRQTARLGTVEGGSRVRRDRAGEEDVRQLLQAFLAQTPPKLGTPRELAERMAELTHTLRDGVLTALQRERTPGGLSTQLEAFRKTLLPGIEPEEFADMYAQTIAYGLFAARVAAPDQPSFTRFQAPYLLPHTNPFLRRFFYEIAGLNLDESISWIVDALAGLLAVADMEAILKDFGRHTRQEDPVVHFYETFLAKYDPRTREMRGVYYTPEPVVSYLVRSVDRLIRSRLSRPRGLVDEDTIILDPALGTGTFLYETINEIYESFARSNNLGQWPGYVAEKLLGRIFGFELLVAPYAVAHLKLSLLLQETGYNARSADERLGVYLTNTLAEGVDAPPIPFAGYISDEANAATGVKRDKPIMVVVGNPPYSGHSVNRGEWIGGLVRDYYSVDGRPLGERNPKWLQDDYVKFIRFGQWRINETGRGILAYISNNGYLDNPTFRGMRQSLMNSFSRIYILDLHGNSRKGERAPGGGPDENVFDIQQGVAIALFVKEPGVSGPAKVYHADLWGEREAKYRALRDTDVDTTEWMELAPHSPSYLFIPQDVDLRAEYDLGWKVTEAMPVNSVGIVTSRDSFVIDFNEAALRARISDFLDPAHSDEDVKQKYLGPRDKLPVATASRSIRDDRQAQQSFTTCLYRPFDSRSLFYHNSVIERSRREVMRHMLTGQNIGIDLCRQVISDSWRHVLAIDQVVDDSYVSNRTRERGYVFPLHLYPEQGQTYHRSDAIEAARKAIRSREGLSAKEQSEQLDEVAGLIRRLYPREEYTRWPNLAPQLIADIEERLGLGFVPDTSLVPADSNVRPTEDATVAGQTRRSASTPTLSPSPAGGAGWTPVPATRDAVTPEDIFHYIYAVLHAPTYRSRYAPFLKSDFPRVPLTGDPALFRDLASLGARLVDLHLMRAPELASPPISSYPQPGSDEVEHVRYDAEGRRVFINKTQHFTHIPPEVWGFHIGGYQVCEKWLKDRRGRKLTYDDKEHYMGVVTALKHTIVLMSEIDRRIPAWPLE